MGVLNSCQLVVRIVIARFKYDIRKLAAWLSVAVN
jgi:hypothetical protein